MPNKVANKNVRRRNNGGNAVVTIRRHELMGPFPKGGSTDQSFSCMSLALTPSILSVKQMALLYSEYRFTFLKLYTASSRSNAPGLHFIGFNTQASSPILSLAQAAQSLGFISGTYAAPVQSRLRLPSTPLWRKTEGSASDPPAWAVLGQYDGMFNQTYATLYLSYSVQFRNPRPSIGPTDSCALSFAEAEVTIDTVELDTVADA